MYSPFTLCFIGDINDKGKDSVLKIQPSSNDTFEWVFRDSKNATPYKTTLMRNSVNARIENLLRLIAYDSEPPSHLQVDVPGYPQIMVTYDDIGSVRELIADAIDFAMGAWPTHICSNFDDMPHLEKAEVEVETESDAESSISEESMPPLINSNYMNYGNYNWDLNAPPTNFWINA